MKHKLCQITENFLGLKRKAPAVENEQRKKSRPEDEISRILSQTLKSTIAETSSDPVKNEIDQSQQSLDFNQNSQAQKPHTQQNHGCPDRTENPNSQTFQHRVSNLIRPTSELKTEIQASYQPTTSSSKPPPQNPPPVSSPISSPHIPVMGRPAVADRPAFPQSIDGPADYVKNEPSRSLYGRLQSNFPATDFPKIDRSANMFNFEAKTLDPEKFLKPPKLTAPPKLTRPPPMLTDNRLGLGQIRGKFEMPTLSKYPKFERKDDILEKPFIKLEPDDGEVKEPKIERISEDHQARF